jgi:hypothetical protein
MRYIDIVVVGEITDITIGVFIKTLAGLPAEDSVLSNVIV